MVEIIKKTALTSVIKVFKATMKDQVFYQNAILIGTVATS